MTLLTDIWKKTLTQIEIRISDTGLYNRFFKFSKLLKIDLDTATVGTSGSFALQILNSKYKSTIQDLLSINYGKKLKVKFIIDETITKEYNEARVESEEEHIVEEPSLLNMKDGMNKDVSDKISKSGLNPKHTFSSYIVGDSNQMAHAAALSISKFPGTYNPLFIYGNTGLGKTHIAQAISIKIIESDISKKVLYITSENFLNDLVRSIKTNSTPEFRRKYRELDCLIIDDIQMISRWVETQKEFFNTFNELHNIQKQVILISDRPPEDIENLEDRLKSRFNGGLSVKIHEPGLETRIAILQQKAKEKNMVISGEVIRDIARLVTNNVRELEGAINKIGLMQSLKPNHNLTLDEIENILGKTAREKRKDLKPNEIINIVSSFFEVTSAEIKGDKRLAKISVARQTVMYIMVKEFGYRLEEVAKFVNRKDHTTIIHGRDNIQNKIDSDKKYNDLYDKLVQLIYK